MNDEWSSAIDIGLDLMVAAVLIFLAVIIGSATSSMSSNVEKEERATMLVSEYRKYNCYDDKIVLGADVVACILTDRGGVKVTAGGKTYGKSEEYELEDIQSSFNVQKSYKATLVRDENDADSITEIVFKEVS